MIWDMYFLDVFGHFGPFEVSLFLCVAVDAVEPRWANRLFY